MTNYSTTDEVWKTMGKDAYTKVREEAVGTGNGTTSTWNLEQQNLIFNTVSVYTDGTLADYSIDLNDGIISGLTATTGSTITADYDYADIPDDVVSRMISSSDQLIDIRTGRLFGEHTDNSEYLSRDTQQHIFFLRNYPVTQINEVQIQEGSDIDPSWKTLNTSSYISTPQDKLVGKFRLIEFFPTKGYDKVLVNYDFGEAIPPTIKELSILLTMRQMYQSTIYKSIFKGYDGFTPVRIQEIEDRIEELIRINKRQSIQMA